MDVRLTQVLQGLDVGGDVLVPVRTGGLDGVADVDALDTGQVQAGVLHLFLQSQDLVQLPHLAGQLIIQGADDSLHIASLPNLLQGNGIMLFAVPAHSHFHSNLLSYLKHTTFILYWGPVVISRR